MLLLRLFSANVPRHLQKIYKEVVPDPHNPRDVFLAEENGYFLMDFGLGKYPFRKIKFQKFGGEFHNRCIIIDRNTEHQRIYHCRAFSKDTGQRVTSISKVADQMIYTDIIVNLLKI